MFAAEGEGEGGVVADGGDDQVVGVGCGEGEAEAVAGADGAADGVELESRFIGAPGVTGMRSALDQLCQTGPSWPSGGSAVRRCSKLRKPSLR